MPRVRFIADIHLHEFPEFSHITSSGMNSRLQDQLKALERILTQGDRPDTCVVCGDIVHSRKALSHAVAVGINQLFSMLSDLFDTVLIIPGNHDYPLKNGVSWLHSVSAFTSTHENIYVHDQPALHPFGTGYLALVPWMPDSERIAAEAYLAYEACAKAAAKSILVSHCAITDARTDNGTPFQGGLKIEDLHPELWGAVILGDFHHAQQIGKFPNAWYVGAPYPMTRNDCDLVGRAIDVEMGPDGLVSIHDVFDPMPLRFVRTSNLSDAQAHQEAGHYVTYQAAGKLEYTNAKESGIVAELVPHQTSEQRLDICTDSPAETILEAYMETLTEEEMDGREIQKQVKSVALEVIAAVREKYGATSQSSTASIELLEVKASNFFSYKQLGPVCLKDRGLVLLEGINKDDTDAESNGAGKSILIEAIYFVLFGETLRPIPVKDIVKNGEKCMVAELKLRLADGRILDILRGRTTTGVIFSYTLDRQPAAPARDTQKYLNELTGWTPELFKQAALFGQRSGELFSCRSDAQRKELLESLCSGVQRFDLLYEEASAMLNDTVQLRAKTSKDVDPATVALGIQQSKQAEAEQYETQFEEDKARELHRLMREQEEALSESDGYGKIESKLRQEVEKLKQQKPKEWEGENYKEWEQKAIDERVAAQSKDTEVTRLQREASQLEATANSLLSKAGGKCGSCEQEVPKSHAEKVAAEYSTKKAAVLESIENLKAEAQVCRRAVQGYAEKAEKLKTQKMQYEQALTVYEANLRELESSLTNASQSIKQCKARLQDLADRVERKRTEANTWGISRQAAQKACEELNAKLAELDENAQILKVMEVTLLHVQRLFGNQGLRTFLFHTLAPRITQLANEALRIISSGTLQVNFSTERKGKNEKLVLVVTNALGAPSLHGNSGGQMRKVDFALYWAISSLVETKINALLIDEALDALDWIAGSRVIELIQQRLASRPTIINITHRNEFKDYFPQVWTVTLEDGRSTLVERPVSAV